MSHSWCSLVQWLLWDLLSNECLDLNSQASPITPDSLLWIKYSSGSLTPKKTNLAGKGLHLELLKGAKQCSRSAGEPGIEPRCPWPCWAAGAPRLQKIFISFRSSCSLLPHPAPPKQPHHEVTACTLACGWWQGRAAKASESQSVLSLPEELHGLQQN